MTKQIIHRDFAPFAFISLIALTLTGTGLKAGAKSNEADMISGYHLRQLAEEVGPIEVYVTHDFCRFDNESNALSYILNGKSSEVTILNHTQKQYWISPFSKFSPGLSYINKMVRYSDYQVLQMVGTKATTTLGLSATLFSYKNPEKFIGTALTRTDKLIVISGEVVGCAAISQNQNLCHAAAKFYSVPFSAAFPLQFTYMNRKGGIHTILKTSVAQKVQFTESRLQIPTGYKRANNQNEIYLNSAGRDTLEDMLK
jgi:hypothetical protein